ncbi:MAG: EamA family transporter [Solirubrobacterales bacterium]
MSNERLAAGGLVMIGVVSVQLGAAVATTVFDELGPGGAVFLRTLFAAAVLLAIWRPVAGSLRGAPLRDVLAFGLVLAGMNCFFFLALDRLPLGIAVALEFTGPLGVAIASSRRPRDLLWAGLATTGILLLAPGIGGGLDLLGALFALTAGGFWAAYILLSARVGRGPVGRPGLAVAMGFATLLLLPIGLADGGGELLDPRLLAIGVAIAMLSSAIPYVVEMEALRRLPPGTFGVLLSMEPAFAALVGFVALSQSLPARELLAIGLIVAASAGALSSEQVVEAAEA